MKKYQDIQQGILRTGVGLMMLSGALCTYAQNETQAPKKKSKVAQARQYEMKEVTGYVYDAATKNPIDGARVQAYNNKNYSVMTDEKGQYTIKVPTFVNSLYVSVPEYNDVQVAISDGKTEDVAMYSSKFNSMYRPTTSITSRTKAEITNTSAISIDEEIENKLAGDILTTSRSGMRGQGINMLIHGINSLNTQAQPLIVLDGMMMDTQLDRNSIHQGFFNNILSGIDPEDIESVEVLKNATSIYGARGGNGVILINTKRGHSMATRIDVNVNAGFELKPSVTPVMNENQYRNYASEFLGTTEYSKHNSPSSNIAFLNSDPNAYWYPMYNGNNENWSDGLYRIAATQNYKISVQGGDDIAMYNLSLGYTDSKSTAKQTGFNRLNIRFNTDIKLSKKLSTQLDLSYSKLGNDLRDNGWAENYESSTVTSPNVLGLIQAPFINRYGYYTGDDLQLHLSHVYAGKYNDDDNNPFNYASAYATNSALANPYWILENGDGSNKNRQEVTQFNLNIMPKWEINKHVTLTNRFAYQMNRTNEKYFIPEAGTPKYVIDGYGTVTSVVKSLFSKETVLYNDLRADWKCNYGMHDVEVFGGFRYTSNTFTDDFMSGYNAGNDKQPDMGNKLAFRSIDGTNDKWINMAYYVNADYSIKNTYFLQATLTAETSSRFGHNTKEGLKIANVKWAIFPSIQLGWVISNEKWMQKAKGVNHLKLTLGYDESGNDNIDYSTSRTYFQSYTYLKTATALQLTNIENPQIQWETTRRFNAALTGSFIDNRLQAGIDFYVNNTSNLLTYKSINYMSGLTGQWINGGSLRNIGVDIHANAILLNRKDWKLQAGFSLGHYKNRITSLPGDDYTTTIYGGEILTSTGNSAGMFYGYKTQGVFASTAEASNATDATADGYLKYPTGVTSNPYKNFQAGDMHFVDQDGNGIIDENDKTIIGNPNPDIFGNIYAALTWKHLTLDINFKYSLGNDIYNYQRRQLESMNNFYNQTTAVVNRWTYEGQKTDVPRVMSPTNEAWVNNERFSDRWIEDGSYLKLKKVRLTYAIPLSSPWIQGLTVWAEANNLFTLTRYNGNDPETSVSNSVLYQGIDAGLLPQSRTFNLGLKINL